MKKILIGSISHETNTLNPFKTRYEHFVERGLYFGEEVISKRKGTNTELGGFIEILEKNDIEIVPSVSAYPWPSGLIEDSALEKCVFAITDTIEKNQPDGILLALHGAMVTESHDDGEGYILEKVRAAAGHRIPIIVTLDLHATLTEKMAENADALVIYRTYPHMDMKERGIEAADIILKTLEGKIKPCVAVAKRPLLIGPPLNVLPVDIPMSNVMAKAREMEAKESSIICACPAHGFMQQDVPDAGVGVAVTYDGNKEKAFKYADELCEYMYSFRKEYFVYLPSPEETISLALQSKNPPVAIADSGDNIGAGTPGDGVALLHELLKKGVKSAFMQICDRESVKIAADAGVGAFVDLKIGGKSDPIYGPPVDVKARVRMVSDGRYLNRAWGGYYGGVYSDMGLSVVLDIDGLTISVNSVKMSPDNIMHAKSLGIYPEDYKMSVCKGGLAFREAYKSPVANSYIQSDTPGYSSSNIKNFTFTKIKRPIFPLDDI